MGGSETYARALTRELAGSSEVERHRLRGRDRRRVLAGGARTRRAGRRRRGLDASPRSRRSSRPLSAPGDPRVLGGRRRRPLPVHGAGAAAAASTAGRRLPARRPAPRPARPLQPRGARSTGAASTTLPPAVPMSSSRSASSPSRGSSRRSGIEPERIVVAPLGVDAAEFEPNLGSRENLLLYPARGWPHKNHARLFEAFSLLRAEDPALRLVLTGGALDGLGRGARRRGGARARRARRAARALPQRRCARLPQPLRGLRPAAARGHGVGLPGRGVATPARCPRSAATRRCSSTRTTPSRSPPACGRRWRAPAICASAACPGRVLHLGGLRRSPRTRLPAGRGYASRQYATNAAASLDGSRAAWRTTT